MLNPIKKKILINYYQSLVHKNIILNLANMKKLKGKIKSYSMYEIEFITEKNQRLIIPKHSIIYFEV